MTLGSSDRKAVTGTPDRDAFLYSEDGAAVAHGGAPQSTEMLRARLAGSVDLAKRHVAIAYREVVGREPA